MSRWASMADGYPKGSICLCPDCWRPVYALERGISLGDKGGRAASAFRPLTSADLVALTERGDINATWRSLVKAWIASGSASRVLLAERPRSGSPAICPNCGGTWVKIAERETGTALDRAYELQLVHIAPSGATPWLTRPKWVSDDVPELRVSRGDTVDV